MRAHSSPTKKAYSYKGGHGPSPGLTGAHCTGQWGGSSSHRPTGGARVRVPGCSLPHKANPSKTPPTGASAHRSLKWATAGRNRQPARQAAAHAMMRHDPSRRADATAAASRHARATPGGCPGGRVVGAHSLSALAQHQKLRPHTTTTPHNHPHTTTHTRYTVNSTISKTGSCHARGACPGLAKRPLPTQYTSQQTVQPCSETIRTFTYNEYTLVPH